eukprot:116144-Rhodomonas_salina.1
MPLSSVTEAGERSIKWWCWKCQRFNTLAAANATVPDWMRRALRERQLRQSRTANMPSVAT